MRNEVLLEFLNWCDKMIDKDSSECVDPVTIAMIDLFKKNDEVLEVDKTNGKDSILDDDELKFQKYVIENLVVTDEEFDNLPLHCFGIQNIL